MKSIILFSLLSLSVFGENWDKTKYINLVANTLYKEAGGESCEGIRLVADVIVNRSNGDKNVVPVIILEPKQFSCWNGKNRNKYYCSFPKDILNDNVHFKWKICLAIAKDIYDGNYVVSNQHINCYFHNRCKPKWSKNIKHKKIVGNHTFGKLER